MQCVAFVALSFVCCAQRVVYKICSPVVESHRIASHRIASHRRARELGNSKRTHPSLRSSPRTKGLRASVRRYAPPRADDRDGTNTRTSQSVNNSTSSSVTGWQERRRRRRRRRRRGRRVYGAHAEPVRDERGAADVSHYAAAKAGVAEDLDPGLEPSLFS